MRAGVILVFGLLAACGNHVEKQEPAPAPMQAPASMALTCEGWLRTTGAGLEQRFGSDNVVEQTLPGPEGEAYVATVVFPNTPAKRVEIVWRDLEGRETPMSVTIRGERSDWIGPHDIRLGTALTSVEQINGRAFQLHGFGWDYGGYVSDWKGGAIADPTCRVGVRFDADEDGDATGASGEGVFMSDAAAVRAARPRVTEIGLAFSAPQ